MCNEGSKMNTIFRDIDYKELLTREIKNNNGIITTKQFESWGFNRQLLSKYEKENFLWRLQQGVYTLSELYHEKDDDNLLMLRSSYLIYSHHSALWQLGLSERPEYFYVTLPRSRSLPRSINYKCKAFYVQPKLWKEGALVKFNYLSAPIRFYNVERTVCDFVRTRDRTNEKTIQAVLNRCNKQNQINLKRLMQYAEKFKLLEEVNYYCKEIFSELI